MSSVFGQNKEDIDQLVTQAGGIMRVNVKENLLVSPFLVFFLINAAQVGIGVFGFQKEIAAKAGYDGWIGVILAGLSFNALIWILYKILNTGKDDVIGIHHQLFGKWLGGALSFFVILHSIYIVVSTLTAYIHVVQVWMFPQLSTWFFGGALLILAFYYVSGGFRTVTGICFLSVVYGAPLVLTIFYPLEFAHPTNLLPIMSHSPGELFTASKQMVFSYVGIQLILIYYPFIKNGVKSQKWAHYGNLFTLTLYLIITFASFLYYNKDQLEHTKWATLTLWKIINLPFLERFEYVGIMIWLFIILPNVCLGLWCASRGAKRLFSVNQRHALFVILVIVFLAVGLIEDVMQVKNFKSIFGPIDIVYLYLYIPFLYIFQLIVVKIKNRKQRKTS